MDTFDVKCGAASSAAGVTPSSTGQLTWTWPPAPSPAGVCPHCGYCPHCGRAHQAQPAYPGPVWIVPQPPWYPSFPVITWTTSTHTTSSNMS